MPNYLKLPEKIECKTINLVRRNHHLDEQMLMSINNNRKFLRKFLYWVDSSKTIDDIKASTDMFIDNWNKGENYAYIITDKDNNLIGSIDFHAIDYKNHNGEFGYWLAEQKTGKGYISEALKSLENILLQKGFVRLIIKCDIENIASNKVAERNGYAFEGTAKKDTLAYGEYRSMNIYAKIKP